MLARPAASTAEFALLNAAWRASASTLLFGRHGVSEAQPGHPVDLGERADHDEIRVRGEEVEAAAVPGVLDEVVVRLVEENGGRKAGTRLRNAASSSPVTIVPVGLFGLQT